MTPLTNRSGRFSPLKAVTLAGLMAPAIWLAYRAWELDLGPLPVKEAMLFSGLWAIRFLVLTLALTPAQRMFNYSRLALVRRMAGIGTFVYALLHFALFIVNAKFDIGFVAAEIALRIYLTIGFAALVGLSLLAATSTDAAIAALGQRWKQLHRIVYAIAILGTLHFFMQSKIDASEATLMTGLFLTLMIYREFIKRRIALSPAVLAVSALAGALATALVEFAWYGLATGIDPWRIAMANLTLAHGPRPALWVMLTGLMIAIAPPLYKTCVRRLRVLDTPHPARP